MGEVYQAFFGKMADISSEARELECQIKDTKEIIDLLSLLRSSMDSQDPDFETVNNNYAFAELPLFKGRLTMNSVRKSADVELLDYVKELPPLVLDLNILPSIIKAYTYQLNLSQDQLAIKKIELDRYNKLLKTTFKSEKDFKDIDEFKD